MENLSKNTKIIAAIIGFFIITNWMVSCSTNSTVKRELKSANINIEKMMVTNDSLRSVIIRIDNSNKILMVKVESFDDDMRMLNNAIMKINPKISFHIDKSK